MDPTVNIFDREQNVIFYSFDKKLVGRKGLGLIARARLAFLFLVVHLSQGSGKRKTDRLRHELSESHPNASGRQTERK